MVAVMAYMAMDRRVKVFATDAGIEDFRTRRGFISWREVRTVRQRRKASNMLFDFAILTLELGTGETVDVFTWRARSTNVGELRGDPRVV
jgi:hypothetical protein